METQPYGFSEMERIIPAQRAVNRACREVLAARLDVRRVSFAARLLAHLRWFAAWLTTGTCGASGEVNGSLLVCDRARYHPGDHAERVSFQVGGSWRTEPGLRHVPVVVLHPRRSGDIDLAHAADEVLHFELYEQSALHARVGRAYPRPTPGSS
jgi:hypothetical protein